MPAISLSTLQALWPNGNSKVPGLLEGITDASEAVFDQYGLSTSLLVAHAMAQFSHECGAGTEMVENIHYTAPRAAQVWPKRFADGDDVYRKIGSFPNDPQFSIKLMDSVYGGRMGNRPGTHDGSTYIGRGLSQLTGFENYDKLSHKVNLDLLGHPEYLSDPRYALKCGVADFVMCGCMAGAMADDLGSVTLRLNGGYIGLAERDHWLTLWKAALSYPQAPEPSAAPPKTGFWSFFKRT